MRMYDIIEKKRDGHALDREEIRFFINGYCNNEIPDYQVAALLMAIFIRGMDERETARLTEAMVASGDRLDLSGIKGIKVDKHSTGGVGDKTTLILTPIVAACGVPVAKMAGRGLGHTGGTIDKLESIPGFKTGLSTHEFISGVKEIGLAIAGQTGNLVPADKKIYALRDVTATVDHISLIASSVMSKKIASGADKIVLDVKTGSGAFMKTLEDSVKLAEAMVKIGNQLNRKTVAVITDMNIPLGNAVGNSLEVIEALETLKGRGPEDLKTVSFELAAKMLELAGVGDHEECLGRVEEVIENGSALGKFEEMVRRQGGDTRVIHDYKIFGNAGYTYGLISEKEGYIEAIRTDQLGVAAMLLGAGRETKDSIIDLNAGILLNKKTGSKVSKGELLATLYTENEGKFKEAVEVLNPCFKFSEKAPETRPLILARVE